MLASTCSIRRWIEAFVGVPRLELAAVDGGDGMGEQTQLPAQSDELAAGPPDRRAIVLPEVRDGLEVRRQTPAQPHYLDVAMGLTLQPAARRDLVDVAVNVDLQQRARMIGWTSGRFRNHTVKAQRPEIQLIDKPVDHPHRVVLSNVVIQILGKQNALYTVFTLDEARHLTPRHESSRIITQQAFSHSLGRKRKFNVRHYHQSYQNVSRETFWYDCRFAQMQARRHTKRG